MKSVALLLVACLFMSLDGSTECHDSHIDAAESSRQQNSSVPLIFDFQFFKSKFSKHYDSFVEDVARGKIFLARAFDVFVSHAAYKVGSQDYYLSLNQMSDWTNGERKATFMHLEEESSGQNDMEEDPSVELDDLMGVIKEIEERKDEPGYRELASEIEKKRAKRETEETKKSKTWIKGTLKKALNSLKSLKTKWRTRSMNKMEVDYRDGNCFTRVKNQGKCGSCYAFAAVALLEYEYCKQTGKLLEFSEQAPVDCGERYGLAGCQGAKLAPVIRYFGLHGLELRVDYPYSARQEKCPYEGWRNPFQAGFVRPEIKSLEFVQTDKVDIFLDDGPLLAAVHVNSRFVDYGGGVDNNAGCDQSSGHAMLLVGRGTWRGKEFYLFRNSHSVDWGHKGYYKMSADAMHECINALYRVKVTFKGKNLMYIGADELRKRLASRYQN